MIWTGTRTTATLALAATAAGMLIALTGAPASAAPSITRLQDSQLDASGLYFVSYDGLVNNESFQASGILSYAGYQYAAWYRSNRNAVLARRQLPAGAWQALELPHALSANDSHNVISLGISPQDGRLHVVMDTHDSSIYYLKSVAGLVSSPGSASWSAASFGAVQRSLDGVSLGAITYPQFAITPQNRLQLSYRTNCSSSSGGSGNG
jgi:hypothetical protein